VNGQIAVDLVNLLYPPRCCACGADAAGWLCGTCDAELNELANCVSCPACALPLAMAGSPCPWCHGRSIPPFEQIVTLAVFQDPLKQLIHRAKFHGRWQTAEQLAMRLGEQARVIALLSQTDVLVSVPLHWTRQIRRGYNQSDLLARTLGKQHRLPVSTAVARIRRTPAQTTLHAREKRQKNVREAFALRKPDSIAGKRVVLVDDVMTTAATLRAVGYALQGAKPASVSALVLAVADPRRREFEAV